MNILFPINRYDIQPIIEYINSHSEISDDFEIEVKEPYLCIEIIGGNSVDRVWLLEVINNFTCFDNMFQEFCRDNAKKSATNQPYLFEPALIEISKYEVRIGYWATNVNSQFVAFFRKDYGEWKMFL